MHLNRFFLLLFLFCSGILTSFDTVDKDQASNKDFIVVLDAGHGGHDPGNLGNGYLEKNIALNIVLKVGEALESQPGIKVIYTRKDDTFVDLYVRGEIANKANADLFVSVHCDSHSSDANGAGTFVLGLHANKQNFEIAKKENSAIYLEDNYETRYAQYDINSPESVIGLTIMQEEFLDQSILLAKMMQDNFSNKLKRNDRKVKQAGFIVLHQTFMPSVLVETGFLTHKAEGSYLNSRKGQLEMGKAIADAIVSYKNNVRGLPSTTSSIPEAVVEAAPQKDPPPTQKTEETPPEANVKEEVKEVVAEKQTPKKPEETPKTSEKPEVAAVEKEIKSPQPIEKEEEKVAAQESINEAPGKVAERTPTNPPPKKEVVEAQKAPEKRPEKQPETKKETVSTKAEKTAVEPGVNIIFKVQLLASSKDLPLNPQNFKGLNKLSKEPYKNLYRYLYGNTKSLTQAKLLQTNAVTNGYKTAFVVAYKDGERIPVPEAVKYLMDQ